MQKRKKIGKKGTVFSVVLMLALIVSLCTMPVSAAVSTSSGLAKGSTVGDTGLTVTSMKSYAVSPGVTEYTFNTNNSSMNSQTVMNVMEVDTSNDYAKVAVAYGDMTEAIVWALMTTSVQAHLWESEKGENVVGAINGCFYDMSNGKPTGTTVIKGITVQESSSYPYFAAYSDGSYSIEKAGTSLSTAASNQSTKQGETVTVTSAIPGRDLIVNDGKVTSVAGTKDTSGNARTSVGIKEDGTLVLFQCDGLQTPRSVGYTEQQEAEMMAELGCVKALHMDGGGSSNFFTQREGESDISLRNTPLDGQERKVSATMLVVSNVPAEGTFDHATVSPDENYYTPESEVELTATGVDFSGATAKSIPEDVTWELENTNMGKLTGSTVSGNKAQTTFVSNGTKGSAVIDLKYDGKVVGSATVNIQEPDTLVFSSEEVNVTYGEESDLGLTASYDNEEVHLKDGDINWEITYEEDYDSETYPIGTFYGLMFHATDNVTVSCTVKVTASYGELFATASVELGKEPLIIADGGDTDGRTYILGEANPCMVVGSEVEDVAYLGDDFGIFSYYGRGGKSSASLVSASDPEYADIVRFGDKAIRIDYDWTGITGIDGACFGPGNSIDVTGSPTGLGVWIYIPDENTPIPWCRLQIATSTDDGETWSQGSYVNFIDWYADEAKMKDVNGNELQVGWNYIEADLSPFVQLGTKVRINAGMLFRAMVKTDPGGEGWTTLDGTAVSKSDLTGYILFDNLCFVYGVNNQDTINPKVTSLSVMNDDGTYTEIENGMTFDQNTFNFYAEYNDNEDTDPFADGIDDTYFYIDGDNVGSGNKGYQSSTLTGITLANGEHSITFYAKDGNGNVTRETRTFYVEGEADYPSISLTFDAEPVVNQDWTLTLSATHPEEIKDVSATMVINNRYPVTDVKFAEGVVGDSNYTASSGTLTIEITEVNVKQLKVYSESATKLADIIVSIPQEVEQGSTISVQVTKGTYNTTVDGLTGSFSTASRSNAVEAVYIVTTDTLIVGKEGTVSVETEDGSPAPGVTVYMAEEIKEESEDESETESEDERGETDEGGTEDTTGLISIGQTDEDGTLVTKKLTDEQGVCVLYAADEDNNWSYKTTVTAFKAAETDGNKPYNISLNMSTDETTQQNISWMSSVDAEPAACIRYSTDEDLTDAQTVEGTDTLLTFSTDVQATRANNVQLSDLKADTTYYYQVGDGETWSDIDTFTTAEEAPDDVRFVVMADVQEEDALTGFSNIAKVIADSGNHYDFGVQTGDAVDNPRSYAEWMDTMELFTLDAWNDMDWLHILGNHDIDDIDNKDKAAKAMFGINEDYYSLEYGDVYIAVMKYTTDRQSVKEFGEWLVEDAAKRTCTWKIVISHASVYYTNKTSEAQMYQEVLPSYFQEAGIDFYMCGHDHSYSRTYPMTDEEVDEDGVVYWICGTTGGKSYELVPDNPDHFEIATLDFESVYLDVSTHRETDENTIIITAYDVSADGEEVKEIDSYEKKVAYCENGDHDYVWNRDTDRVTCTKCPFVSTMKTELLSGFVTDEKTGRLMHLVSGQAQTGQVSEQNISYYFDEDGVAYEDGTYTFCGETCTMKDGHVVSWENEKVIDIGMAGFNIGFVVYDDYSLYIEGEGDMWNFTRGTAPWGENRSNMKTVTISKGITSIGDAAFYFYHHLTSITFEEDSLLETIGEYAFRENSTLKTITLPDSVKTISSYAFAECSNLTSIYIPDGIEYLADNAFRDCSKVVLSVGYHCDYAIQYAVDHEMSYVERLTSCTMELSDYSYDYDGTAKEPEVTLLYNDEPQDLILGTDYTVAYSDNVEPGTATVTVTGNDKDGSDYTNGYGYTGTLTEQFTIRGEETVEPKTTETTTTSTKNTAGSKDTGSEATGSEATGSGATGSGATGSKATGSETAGSETVGSETTVTTKTKLLKLKAVRKNKKIKLKWNKVENADGYLIYGSRINKSYKLIKTIKDGSKHKYTVKNPKKGKAYKYRVKAYKLVNGEKKILKTSNSVHIYTKGNKNYTNAKKVKVKDSKVSLQVGDTSKISAKVKKVEAGKKLSKRVNKLRYRTTNKTVATVNVKGKIKAVNTGKCTIVVYAANGKLAIVKVTVK